MRKLGIGAAQLGKRLRAPMRATLGSEAAVDATIRQRRSGVSLAPIPEFSTWQPFLDEIISHPAPDEFRARHNFRRTIEIPGFHATTWYDIFQTSVIAAFNDIQARAGNQRLWIGPNDHYFIYETNFWPRDPYFEWFDYWLKGEPTGIMDRPAVHYSPRAWVAERTNYIANDWHYAERWPLPGATPRVSTFVATALFGGSTGSPRTYTPRSAPAIRPLGGRSMLIDAGPRDQRPARRRNHGLIYRSEACQRISPSREKCGLRCMCNPTALIPISSSS
jgi:predicted acyl esterase